MQVICGTLQKQVNAAFSLTPPFANKMPATTRYEEIVEWLLNQWPFVVLAFLVVGLGFVPQIRDGITTICGLLPKKKHIASNEDVEIQGERITFEEKMTSRDCDVVKIFCHTHILGVAAERIWIGRKYPESEFKKQRLTTLDLLTTGRDGPNKVFFDVIELELNDGRKKTICFDISEFFKDNGSSLSPEIFMSGKLRKLYK